MGDFNIATKIVITLFAGNLMLAVIGGMGLWTWFGVKLLLAMWKGEAP